MLGVNYGPDSDPLAILASKDRGAISVYAQNRDYHDVIKGKLKELAGKIAASSGADVKVFVDTAPVMEKPLAEAAGHRLAGQAHQSGQPRIRLLAVPRQHLHHRRARAGRRRAGSLRLLPRLPRHLPDRSPFPRPTGSMRGAASPTSPSRTRGRSRSNSARRSATASMAATTALRSARGTSSRGPHPRRSSPPATICVRRRWPTCSALDDGRFRALFSGSPVKRIGRDRFMRNVLIAAGNSGDAALVAACRAVAWRSVAAGARRGGVGAVAAAGARRRSTRLADERVATETGRTRSWPNGAAATGRQVAPLRSHESSRHDADAALLHLRRRLFRHAPLPSSSPARRSSPAPPARRKSSSACAPPASSRYIFDGEAHFGCGPIGAGRHDASDRLDRARTRPAIRCSRAGRDVLAHEMPRLAWIGYLSTVGVYGDHGGGWVDETSECRPVSRRSVMRVAGRAGLAVARARDRRRRSRSCGCPASTGRAAMPSSISPTAPRGGWSSPARCSTASMSTTSPARCGTSPGARSRGIFNVTDDRPAPPQDVVAYAAELMGVEPPPEIPFETAQLSPMARSFYGENKRVSNAAIKQAGYRFVFPDYRAALDSMWAERQLAGRWRNGCGKPDQSVVMAGRRRRMVVICGHSLTNG